MVSCTAVYASRNFKLVSVLFFGLFHLKIKGQQLLWLTPITGLSFGTFQQYLLLYISTIEHIAPACRCVVLQQ